MSFTTEQRKIVDAAAASMRGRMNTALKYREGGWRCGVRVSEYGRYERGRTAATLYINLIRRGRKGYSNEVPVTVRWSYPYSSVPTEDQVRKDFIWGLRSWRRAETMSTDIVNITKVVEELEDIFPLVTAAFKLANPDKLIQMAGEGDWKKVRKMTGVQN